MVFVLTRLVVLMNSMSLRKKYWHVLSAPMLLVIKNKKHDFLGNDSGKCKGETRILGADFWGGYNNKQKLEG